MFGLQVSVLRGAWPGLFLLGLIQCRHQVDLTSLLSMVASHLQNCLQRDSITLVRLRALLATLNNIKLTASKLECLELDLQEFAYLRLFSLFRFSKSSHLSDVKLVCSTHYSALQTRLDFYFMFYICRT